MTRVKNLSILYSNYKQITIPSQPLSAHKSVRVQLAHPLYFPPRNHPYRYQSLIKSSILIRDLFTRKSASFAKRHNILSRVCLKKKYHTLMLSHISIRFPIVFPVSNIKILFIRARLFHRRRGITVIN